jgi:predicted aspartyl protease
MRKVERRWPLAVVAVALSATSSAAEPAGSQLPFRLFQDHLIVVKGGITGADGLKFMIDTGASRTLVEDRIARKLRLESQQGDIELESFRNAQAREVIVPELRFGPVRLQAAHILAADLSVLSWSGARIDAVIGLDVLMLGSFRVDYASRRMEFGPIVDAPSAVAFQAVSPLLTVDLAIGSSTARLVVDTGAPRLTLFPNRMQSRLPGFLLKGARTIQSPGGMSQVRDVELAAVRLGPTEWLHMPALLVDVPESSYQDLDGVLAPSCLAVKSIDFDFQRNRLSWRK